MKDALVRYWRWLVGGGLFAVIAALAWSLLRAKDKARAAELKHLDALHVPKIEALKREQAQLAAALGEKHVAVASAETRVVEAEAKLAQKYEAKGLSTEEITARFKRVGKA